MFSIEKLKNRYAKYSELIFIVYFSPSAKMNSKIDNAALSSCYSWTLNALIYQNLIYEKQNQQ